MDITSAIREIEATGGYAHRAAWDKRAALFITDERPVYRNGAGEESDYKPTWADIIARDWFIEVRGETDDPSDIYNALIRFVTQHRPQARSCADCSHNQGGECTVGYDLKKGEYSYCNSYEERRWR